MPHLAASGRTSFPADKDVPKALYRVVGYRVCGERAVRVDILERLADLIRPALAWRAGLAGAEAAGRGRGRRLHRDGEHDLAHRLVGRGFRLGAALARLPDGEAAEARRAAACAGAEAAPTRRAEASCRRLKPRRAETPVEAGDRARRRGRCRSRLLRRPSRAPRSRLRPKRRLPRRSRRSRRKSRRPSATPAEPAAERCRSEAAEAKARRTRDDRGVAAGPSARGTPPASAASARRAARAAGERRTAVRVRRPRAAGRRRRRARSLPKRPRPHRPRRRSKARAAPTTARVTGADRAERGESPAARRPSAAARAPWRRAAGSRRAGSRPAPRGPARLQGSDDRGEPREWRDPKERRGAGRSEFAVRQARRAEGTARGEQGALADRPPAHRQMAVARARGAHAHSGRRAGRTRAMCGSMASASPRRAGR